MHSPQGEAKPHGNPYPARATQFQGVGYAAPFF